VQSWSGREKYTQALFEGKQTPYGSAASTIILQSVEKGTHGGERGQLGHLAFLSFNEVAMHLLYQNYLLTIYPNLVLV
jgi:hypothetical protein